MATATISVNAAVFSARLGFFVDDDDDSYPIHGMKANDPFHLLPQPGARGWLIHVYSLSFSRRHCCGQQDGCRRGRDSRGDGYRAHQGDRQGGVA